MTDKQLRQLSRTELLEMLLEQGRENERLQTQIAELEEKLKDREIRIDRAGSIAEAALALNRVFEAAEASCVQYVENIRLMNERMDELEEIRDAKSKARASMIIQDAQLQSSNLEAETRARCDALLAKTDAMVEEKWNQISQRLTALYKSHEGLMELVSQGVSLVPGGSTHEAKKP